MNIINISFEIKFKDIYELNYKRLIENNKGEIDKLLEFCNLDLSEKCYSFTKFSKPQLKQ